MTTKRRDMTEQETTAAKRLKSIFNAKKSELGHTQATAGAAIGIEQATLNQYMNGKIAMNIKFVLKIANLLNVSPSEIYPEIVKPLEPTIRARVKESNNVNYVTKEGQDIPLYSRQEITKFVNGYPPQHASNNHPNKYAPGVHVVNENCYALQMYDKSMEPEISEGSYIYVDPAQESQNNSIVLAKADTWPDPCAAHWCSGQTSASSTSTTQASNQSRYQRMSK